MLMYDDPSIKMDWREIIRWNDKEIAGFFGDWRFLSNFQPCKVWFEGLEYPSSEAAYMGAKVLDLELRKKFATLSPYEAKKLGHQIKLRPNWDEIKFDIMLEIIFNKFLRNTDLRVKLIETGDKYLEETNFWSDTIWGVDIKKGGQNNLGKILMKVRSIL